MVFLNADCQDEIRETLLVNPFITDVEDFEAAFDNGRLSISFTAVTKFGNTEVDYDV